MTNRRGPSLSTLVATLGGAAAIFVAIGLTDIKAQRPLAQEPPAIEVFRGREAVAGEVLVAFRRAPNLALMRAEMDADTDASVGSGRLWHAHSRTRNISALIAYLSAHPDVLYAEPNYIVYADDQPNDPRFAELWGFLNIGQTIGGIPGTPGADIRVVPAWDAARGSRNSVIGVVDTGIDYTHPDLTGNIWSAPASFSVTIGSQTITCAAGTHGFNAITKSCDPFDDNRHGTHVAGTIGAVTNNSAGVAGINWYASMMGLKFLNAGGAGSIVNAINAIEFAIQAKAAFPAGGANVRVLSNSWGGGGFSQAMLDEITRANQNEMLFVAAAGNAATNNDTSPFYPASYPVSNLVAVAATTNQDSLATFSNYGANSVHLGAPGVQILSTLPGETYGYLSGTSMATPHVSGAAALLLSRCTASMADVKSLLLNNVDHIAGLSGVTMTGGRLNAGRAVAACGPSGNTSPSVALIDPAPDTVYAAPAPILVRATALDSQGVVSQVAFYAGTALIGIDTSSPFETTWNASTVGHHALTAVATDPDGATSTSAEVTIHIVPGAASLPFGGSAAPIPGTIEAENFNEGGEGVGYHDTTLGNTGGRYRSTDVDIEATTDAGGGYSLGYVTSGEWLAYSTWAVASADYTLQVRVASAGTGGVFHVEVDGFDVTGPLVVPNTGGWQTWQTISRDGISLTAGSHMMRIVVDSKGATGYLGNLNYFRWTSPGLPPPTSTPFGGTPAAIPGLIEAERFDDGGEGIAYHDTTAVNTTGQYRQTAVDIESTTDAGGGYSLSYVAAGEWLNYAVSVATTAQYTLEARVAASGAGGTFHVEIDGVNATGPLAVPNTGGWQTWRTVAVGDIPLTAGSHVMRVVIDSNGVMGWMGNLNYLRWIPYVPPTPFGGTPASIPGLVEVENFDEGGQGIAYHDSSPGNTGAVYRQTDVDIETTSDAGGGYGLGYVVAGEWLKYSITVASAGSYTLQARVASLFAGGTFHIEIDGVNVTGTMTVPATGGWQAWQTITRTGIALSAGPHSLRVAIDTNGGSGYFGNLNHLRWIAEP